MRFSPKLVAVIIFLLGIKNKSYSIQAVKRDIFHTYCTYTSFRAKQHITKRRKHCRNINHVDHVHWVQYDQEKLILYCYSPFPLMKKAFRVEKWLTFRQYFIYQKQRTLGKNKWIGICAKYTKTSKNRSIFHGMVTISIVSVKIHQKYIHVLLHTNELSTMEFIYIQYNWKAIATEVFWRGAGVFLWLQQLSYI